MQRASVFQIEKPAKKNGTCEFKYSISSKISDKISELFYRLGFFIASHPWKTIIITLIVVILLGLGNFNFYFEKNPLKLWVPTNSKYVQDTEWLLKNYEETHREETIIIKSNNNILEPKYLKKLAIINSEIIKAIAILSNGTQVSWNDVCFKVPYIKDFVDEDYEDDEEDKVQENELDSTISKEEEETEELFNPSVHWDPKVFCKIVENLPKGCRQLNLVEMWNYDINIIDKLNLNDILIVVNKLKNSPVTGYKMDFLPMLGDIERNSTGHIVSAKTLMSNWFLYVNYDEINHEKIGTASGAESWASEQALAWESKFIEIIKKLQPILEDDDFKIYFNAERSYSDLTMDDLYDSFGELIISACFMFIFMQLVLSKYNWIELRIILGTSGLICVGLTIILTCGLCSMLSVSYSPLHASFPLLLMGLGVDDIFVMMACYRKVQTMHGEKTIPERIGLMLEHSGVSITVTSITDLVVFIVGTTTTIESLQSYCIFSSFGVLIMYLLVITFFVAIFTLDEYRVSARRNAIIPCLVHDESQTKLWMDKQFMQRFIKFFYTKLVLTRPGKIIILLFVVTCTGFSINNLFKVQKNNDQNWIIPETSYLFNYTQMKKDYYPKMGYEAGLYTDNLNISETEILLKLNELSLNLKAREDLVHNFDTWIDPFDSFVQLYYKEDIFSSNMTDYDRRNYLSKFLFSPDGGKYQANFRFKEKLKCGEPIPDVQISSINFNFIPLNDTENVYVMHHVKNIVSTYNLTTDTSYTTVWSKVFVIWELADAIDGEVLRNVFLALVCVMICTAILILNLQMCFWIFVSVVLTLVNVGGFMYVLDLKIDIISCLSLLLAVGLCVDYAAHIGHTFLTITNGTRNERTLETALHIGAAIFYGAGSTILAMSMLSVSSVLSSISFFKNVFLIISFGVFHGIVVLPVILSLVGPQSYHKRELIPTQDIHY